MRNVAGMTTLTDTRISRARQNQSILSTRGRSWPSNVKARCSSVLRSRRFSLRSNGHESMQRLRDFVMPLHRESLDEVLSDLRQQRASLVLISVTRYGSQSSCSSSGNGERVSASAGGGTAHRNPELHAPLHARAGPAWNSHSGRCKAAGGMADTPKSSRHPGLERSAAVSAVADQSRSAGSIDGLLAVLRAAVRFVAADFDGASARASPEHSAQHADEQVLSGEASAAETLPRSRPTHSCGPAVRESRAIGRESGKSPRTTRRLRASDVTFER